MSRTSIKVLGAAAVGLSITSICLIAQAQPAGEVTKAKAAEPAPAFKPVISVEVMMENQGRLFKEVKEGILDKDWKNSGKSAWLLAELGNVNQYQHDDAAYKKFAKQMSDASKTMAEAIDKRDEAAAKSALTSVGETC